MIRNLTGLRFFVAIWVVFYHVKEAVHVPVLREVVNLGYLGVDVFFILSGYILTHVYYEVFFSKPITALTLKDFIRKRFARIYPLHFVTLVAAIAFLVMLNTFSNADNKMYWDHVLPQLFLVHAWGMLDSVRWNFPSWSVSAEWLAYLFLFPVVALLYRRYHVFGLSVLAFSLFCGWVIVTIYFFNNDIGSQLQLGFIRIIPEFILGVLTYILFWKDRTARKVLIIGFGYLVLIVSSILISGNVQFVIVLIVPLFLVLLHRGHVVLDFLFGSQITLFLGEISYSIYMTHFFSRAVNGIINSVFFHNQITGWYFLIYFLLTIGFSVVGYFLIEVPFRRWINKFNF